METYTHTNMVKQTTQHIEEQAYNASQADIVLKCQGCNAEYSLDDYKKGDYCPDCKEAHMSTNGTCPSCDEPLRIDDVCDCYTDHCWTLAEYDRYNEEWV